MSTNLVRRWPRSALAAAALTVAALIAAGCGGSSDDPQQGSAPSDNESDPAQTDATSEAGEAGVAGEPDPETTASPDTEGAAQQQTPEDANSAASPLASPEAEDSNSTAPQDDESENPDQTIEAPSVPQQEITFTTSDGETLGGTIFGEGERGIVLAHMRGRDRQTWFAFAERAAAEGYRVLAFDFRGYGTSSGAADTGLDTDIAAAVGALRGEGASQVIVMGASMGGTAAVSAGTQLDLAGVVALSAPGNFLGLEALEVAVNVTEPLLAIAGELDQPYADAIVGIGENAPNGQSILLETSQHGTNLFVSHDTELTNLLLAFARDNFA